jgi:hypothetical protein
MARQEHDVPQAVPANPSRRWIPPLVGLGLLLLVTIFIVFSRGPREGERAAGHGTFLPPEEFSPPRVVHTVHHADKYTILELAGEDKDDNKRFWLAAPRMDVAVGDRVVYGFAPEARDFPSKSLNRTFDRILLARDVFKLGPGGEPIVPEPQDQSNPHGGDPHGSLGHAGHGDAGTSAKVAKLAKPDGGQAIAELSAAAEKFAGKAVKVRGTIVKARQRVRPAPGAPPTNWYHVQDEPGGPLLLFTSADDLQRGDVVLLAGALAVDKDFGSGLVYKLLIESPQVTRESAANAAKEQR